VSAATAILPAAVGAADILLRWPAGEPLAALVSGGSDRAHNGWSIFGRPSATVVIPAGAGPAEVRAMLADAFARTPRGGVEAAKGVARRGGKRSLAPGVSLRRRMDRGARLRTGRDVRGSARTNAVRLAGRIARKA
jgi:hypothetical protein